MTCTPRIFASVATPPLNLTRIESFHSRNFATSTFGSVKVMPRCADSRALTIWCVA